MARKTWVTAEWCDFSECILVDMQFSAVPSGPRDFHLGLTIDEANKLVRILRRAIPKGFREQARRETKLK